MVGLACRDFRLGLRDWGLVFRDWGFGLGIGVKRFGFVFLVWDVCHGRFKFRH